MKNKKPRASPRFLILNSLFSSKGFTLIELLMYIAILGSLLIAVSLYFATAAESRVKNQSIAEVNQQGALAMETVTQIIRNASSITTPLAGSSDASLTLVVPTGSLSPTVFDLDSGVLQITEGVAAAVPLTNSKVQLTSLTYTNLTRPSTPGVVRVEFTVKRLNPNNKNEYDYEKTFTSSAALRWP